MQINESTAAKIAEYLLQIKAIKLQPNNPFTWASGLKSPIYSDNRLSLSHPAIRTFIKEALAQEIKKNYPQVEAIIGVATAGIAPGALVADALNLPFGYVRSEPKKHGMGKQVEGDIRPDMAVVVIEDLVSTGKSSLQAVSTLREFGSEVLGLASIFTYGLQIAEDNFLAANCKLLSLCNYDALIETAVDKGYVNEADILVLKSWRTNPEAFGK
ncbi:MAG: orotate phosphoribosyltransferase [Sphingobacteriales bacterium]|jgi:orotate phosphoribosyltransferase|nr:orotate phosphoribosyltransferase [Sphingobacteriales bacterium]